MASLSDHHVMGSLSDHHVMGFAQA
ncbi:uncharacterized protein G2W53_028393 [Senna tora]|uniref:Uncharacterized protein n=1 Tax=Senna tora TaxID=362788 RepID=A0A834TCB2_9FABA|nr:uncharacterized protein G2W53_028393 [Senna tora]